MIQLLGLRTYIDKNGEEKKTDKFFERNWKAPNIFSLFQKPQEFINQIPEQERWNMFYTIANCTENKREFKSLDVIAFDIDGVPYDRLDETITICLTVLGIKRQETGIVASGNGLHLLIGLETPAVDVKFFKEHKPHYKAVADKINAALANVGIAAKTDTTVFEPRRILRIPGTWNRKPNRSDTMAILVEGNIVRTKFSLKAISGIPDVSPKDQLNPSVLKRYPTIDKAAVLAGCNFLQWAKDNANQVIEPQWYAALSIVGRFDDNGAAAHEISQGHKHYSAEETTQKIAQACENSGPRTCDNINALWGKCQGCKNFKKVNSPILLKGEGHLSTEHTGFHTLTFKADGSLGKAIPNYDELKQYFDKKYNYRIMEGTKTLYTWAGTHYKEMKQDRLEEFAQNHFDPKANNNMIYEFTKLVHRQNITEIDWFNSTIDGFINFKNGVLEIATGDFRPHDKARGFRYVLDFDYDPSAKCPQYDKMMEKITLGRKELELLLDQAAGYCISGMDYIYQKAILLVGEGANGKSVWTKILAHVAGRGNFSNLSMKALADAEYNRHLLDGKLYNLSEETPLKSLQDTSMFKLLVGGGTVQVRSIYKAPYEIPNRAKLLLTCNELPKAYDTSYGFHRRFIIIPFNAKFTKEDKDYDSKIEYKLKTELSGIFNRYYQGLKNLIANDGFTECEITDNKLIEYELDTDNVKRWVEENIQYLDNGHMDDKFTPINDLYTAYKSQIESEKEFAVTKNTFAKRLTKLIKNYSERYLGKKIDKKFVRGLRGVDFYEGAGLEALVNTSGEKDSDYAH